MSFPAAYVGSMTASGDVVTGPGVGNVLIGGMPASVMGDIVTGPAVAGAITAGCSNTVLIGGRPAARATSMVAGSNPQSGVPVSSAIAMGNPTVLIGG